MKRIWAAGAIVLVAFAVFITLFMTKQKAHADFPNITYCGVAFKDPVYEFKDASGNSLFVLDNIGNLYMRSSSSSKVFLNYIGLINAPPSGFGIKLNSNFIASFSTASNVYFKGAIIENQIIPSVVQNGEILFREPLTQTPLALFDANGNFYIAGKAIYFYAQVGCTGNDGYLTSSGYKYWKEYFCDPVLGCMSQDIDADVNTSYCLAGEGLFLNIGGERDMPLNPCCGDEAVATEKKITRTCGSGLNMCTTDSNDDACCTPSTDCVYDSSCTGIISAICSPWNSALKVACSSGSWAFSAYCPNECVPNDKCKRYTTCSNGTCAIPTNCPSKTMCSPTDHNGCLPDGQCNTTSACSIGEGDGNYAVAGKFYCKATCDGNGNCDYATQCTDCSTSGIVNGCACQCNGYGIAESRSNGNTCFDGIDNDCDGKADRTEIPDCFKPNGGTCTLDAECLSAHCGTDSDLDGYIIGTTHSGKCIPDIAAPESGYYYKGENDCNDASASIYPSAAEICDLIDQNCNGNLYDGFTYENCQYSCDSVPAYHWYAANYCCGNDAGETWCAGSGSCQHAVWYANHCGDGACNCGETCDTCDCNSCECIGRRCLK